MTASTASKTSSTENGGTLAVAYELINSQSTGASQSCASSLGPATNSDVTTSLFGSSGGFSTWKNAAGPNGVSSNLLPHMDALTQPL